MMKKRDKKIIRNKLFNNKLAIIIKNEYILPVISIIFILFLLLLSLKVNAVNYVVSGSNNYSATTDTNITENVNFTTHLNLSWTSNPPYNSLVAYWSFDNDNSEGRIC